MATRQQRIDAFIHEGEPPADQLLEVLCEDHVGTYVIPFLCRWSSDDWRNAVTGVRIEATILGWRERKEAEDRCVLIDPSNDQPANMQIAEQARDPE